MPVTTPVVEFIDTAELPPDQVPPGVAHDKVMVLPAHTELGPVTSATGVVATVTLKTSTQPGAKS